MKVFNSRVCFYLLSVIMTITGSTLIGGRLGLGISLASLGGFSLILSPVLHQYFYEEHDEI